MRLLGAVPVAIGLVLANTTGAAVAQQQQQQEPPCFKEFSALRQEVEKRAQIAQNASKHRSTPAEGCKVLTSYNEAENAFIKYMDQNGTWCGIPAQMIQQVKLSHEKTLQVRKKVCQAAANGGGVAAPRAAQPTLSDAIGSSKIPDADNIRTGRGSGGTFDTLSGNPLR